MHDLNQNQQVNINYIEYCENNEFFICSNLYNLID